MLQLKCRTYEIPRHPGVTEQVVGEHVCRARGLHFAVVLGQAKHSEINFPFVSTLPLPDTALCIGADSCSVIVFLYCTLTMAFSSTGKVDALIQQ